MLAILLQCLTSFDQHDEYSVVNFKDGMYLYRQPWENGFIPNDYIIYVAM